MALPRSRVPARAERHCSNEEQAPYHNKNGDEGMIVSLTIGTPKPDDIAMTLDRVDEGTTTESTQVASSKLFPFIKTNERRPGSIVCRVV